MTTYRASFEYSGSQNGSPVEAKRYTVLGFGVKVVRSFYQGKLFYVDFQIVTPFDSSNATVPAEQIAEIEQRYATGTVNPAVQVAIPLAAIAMGIIVVGGLVALYYNFKEVHELVESPQGSLLALAVVAIAGVIVWKQIK